MLCSLVDKDKYQLLYIDDGQATYIFNWTVKQPSVI